MLFLVLEGSLSITTVESLHDLIAEETQTQVKFAVKSLQGTSYWVSSEHGTG